MPHRVRRDDRGARPPPGGGTPRACDRDRAPVARLPTLAECHLAADKLIAADPVYAATCARLDAKLAEMLEAGRIDDGYEWLSLEVLPVVPLGMESVDD